METELGSGGMAHVFRGFDPALNRPVAIKVLRPELATAYGAERFLREARLLARLSHPNVIPIHDVGEATGLYFYVMDLLEGGTLRDRLELEPLTESEAFAIGFDLLKALEAAHAAGIIHRDVKPSNVFLVDGRAVLADFGIAKYTDDDVEPLTATGVSIGTPGYMAPEQVVGGAATPSSDLYGVGVLLLETMTGQRPHELAERGEWEGVRPSVESVIERALARDPSDRWPDAASFRRALKSAAPDRDRTTNRRIALGLATAGILLAATWWVAGRERRPIAAEPHRAALAVLPCSATLAEDSVAGKQLARIAALNLQGIPGLRTVPVNTSFGWWQRHADRQGVWTRATDALEAEFALRCVLARSSPGRFEARFELVDALGTSRDASVVYGPADDPPLALGDSLTVGIIRIFQDEAILSEAGSRALSGHHIEAVRAFLSGEAAFQRGAWTPAQNNYSDALRIDSSFALARWRLADIRRWTITASATDLRGLDSVEARHFGQVDRMLLAARVMGHSPSQLLAYQEILAEHPRDAYATLIYGDELFHRGPLWGVPLDSARRVLRLATRLDSSLVPAFDHLAQLEIRLGDRTAARETLDRLASIAAAPPEVEMYLPALWEQAFLERFDHPAAEERRPSLFRTSTQRERWIVALSARRGLSLDLAHTELALGEILTDAEDAGPEELLTGHVAQGLALFAMGRPMAALGHFDSAASLGDPEAYLQAAQWRLLPGALGAEGIPEEEARRGRDQLRQLARDRPETGGSPEIERRRARAAWTLSLAALQEGDTLAADRRAGQLAESDWRGADRLRLLLESAREAARGRYDGALAQSAPLTAYDSAGKIERPFSRAATHLLRAEWLRRLSRIEDAERELIWYEAEDLEGMPVGAAQAGEVDWAFGPYARLRRARIAFDLSRIVDACRHATDAMSSWSEAEPALGRLVAEAQRIRNVACAE